MFVSDNRALRSYVQRLGRCGLTCLAVLPRQDLLQLEHGGVDGYPAMALENAGDGVEDFVADDHRVARPVLRPLRDLELKFRLGSHGVALGVLQLRCRRESFADRGCGQRLAWGTYRAQTQPVVVVWAQARAEERLMSHSPRQSSRPAGRVPQALHPKSTARRTGRPVWVRRRG